MILQTPSVLSRPAVVFSLVWIVVFVEFYIYSFNNGIVIKTETVVLIVGSILGAFLMEATLKSFRSPKKVMRDQTLDYFVITRSIRKIWMLGVLVTVVLQGGFPMLWAFIGDPRGYADFGIPTLNGGLVALYVVLTLLTFLGAIKSGEKNSAVNTLYLFLYCIATMNRGLMVYLVLNLLALYLLYKSVSVKRVVPIVLMFLTLVYLLNFIAENRSIESKKGVRDFLETTSANQFEDSLIGDFDRGLTWLSVYSTAPLVNLNHNIDKMDPTYMPDYVLRGLFPSIVRDLIYKTSEQEYELRYSLEMANKAFNTFTFYANYLRDFGFYGCFAILAIINYAANRIYPLALNGGMGFKVAYCGIFAAIVLTPFTDFFGTLVLPAQVLIGILIERRVRKLVLVKRLNKNISKFNLNRNYESI